jgi:hypothetical protein
MLPAIRWVQTRSKDNSVHGTFSLNREEHRLRVSEKRVLGIFGPKRDLAWEEWREVGIRKLHNLYSSPNIIMQIKSRE